MRTHFASPLSQPCCLRRVRVAAEIEVYSTVGVKARRGAGAEIRESDGNKLDISWADFGFHQEAQDGECHVLIVSRAHRRPDQVGKIAAAPTLSKSTSLFGDQAWRAEAGHFDRRRAQEDAAGGRPRLHRSGRSGASGVHFTKIRETRHRRLRSKPRDFAVRRFRRHLLVASAPTGDLTRSVSEPESIWRVVAGVDAATARPPCAGDLDSPLVPSHGGQRTGGRSRPPRGASHARQPVTMLLDARCGRTSSASQAEPSTHRRSLGTCHPSAYTIIITGFSISALNARTARRRARRRRRGDRRTA